jgi:nitrite reductase (NADH) small subunit
MDIDQEHPVVICPWHKWEFDARTGRAVWDQNYRVRVYPVTIENDRVLVGMRPPRAIAESGLA